MAENPKIVLVIPGFWPDRANLLQSIATESAGYIYAGLILLNTATHEHWEMSVIDPDPNLLRTLSLTGHGSITTGDLRAIAEHTHVCIIEAEGGNTEAAKGVMDAAAGLIKAGGAAVYVESTGKAHSATDWTRLSETQKPTALYDAYVALISSSDGLYTCGMHNIGLPDAALDTGTTTEEDARLLRAFNLYRLLESPDLETGHTFSLTPESTFFRIALLPCATYTSDDLFFNPYGVWHLTPL